MRRIWTALATMVFLPQSGGAQAVTRFSLGWTDNSYRYEGTTAVPVGPQTATLTITVTRGDSVVATLPTANPAIVDTLDGTLTATRLVLRSRPRGSDMRRSGSDGSSERTTMSFTMRFEIDLDGDVGRGTRTTEISLPPGMSSPPMRIAVTARRQY